MASIRTHIKMILGILGGCALLMVPANAGAAQGNWQPYADGVGGGCPNGWACFYRDSLSGWVMNRTTIADNYFPNDNFYYTSTNMNDNTKWVWNHKGAWNMCLYTAVYYAGPYGVLSPNQANGAYTTGSAGISSYRPC